MKRFECESSCQETYSKYEDKILKRSQELTILCETDLALLMFSPDGRLTSFGSNGRVENTFLRFLEQPDECKGGPIWNAEYLSVKLKDLKGEAELLEKIATIEELEENLDQINRQKREAQEKLRYYNPDVENINSVAEAEEYQNFLISALERIRLSKENLLGKQIVPEDAERNKVKLNAAYRETSCTGRLIEFSVDIFRGTPIMQQDARCYEDKFLGRHIVRQDTDGYVDKLLGKHIVPQESESDEDNLLGKAIVQQGTESYTRAADDSDCDVSITSESSTANNKRYVSRGGRARKKTSSRRKTHVSMDSTGARSGRKLQGNEHSSKIETSASRSEDKGGKE